MRAGQLVLLSCAAMAAGCAEAVERGGGDGRAHYEREVSGASTHVLEVVGVSMRGEVALDRVLASATDLAPALGDFAAEDFTVSTTMQTSASGAPIAYVSGRQTVRGVPIVDSHLYVAIRPTGGDHGTLLASSYRLFDGADVDVTPAIGRDDAETLGREVLRAAADTPAREVSLVIREIDGELALVWDVRIDEHDGHALVRAAGPHAGAADAVDDRVYETHGTVSAWIAVGGAPGARGNAQLVPQRDTTVRAGSATATSDADGSYRVEAGSGATITAAVVGPAARVKSSGSTGVSASAPAAATVDLALGAATGERILAQTTAFHYVTAARRFLMDNGIAAGAFGSALTTNVNMADTCNAYFTPGGRTLNFFRSGGGCNNSAEASIVVHEYGHFVDEVFGDIQDGGLSEGWGDLLACFVLKQPVIGGDLFQNGEPLRTCDNSYRFPTSGYDEEHDLGQAWAGFAWHARAGLIEKVGAEAGDALARALVLPSLTSNAPDIPSAVREVFLRDDDDGNLANGTPHWDVLVAAARRHRLDFVLDRDVTPPAAIRDLALTAPTATSITVRWTAPGDDGATGTASRYELRWSRERFDESSFRRGTRIGAPAPTEAGTMQSTTFSVPPGGPVWVAIRAIDEMGNLGPLSNVVTSVLPDERTVFLDGGENGLNGWEATGLWHITTRRSAAGRHAFWYGDEATGTYDTPGRPNRGTIVSPVIDLHGIAAPRLAWREFADVERIGMYDVLRIEVFDVDHPDLLLGATKAATRTDGFQARLLDLTGFGDRRVRIRFSMDTVDSASNRGEGWFVDEIRVFGAATMPTPTPVPGQLVINEILADPPAGYDANGDGTASTTSDEFVEMVNAGSAALDLSGAVIADATGVRRTLAAGTTVAPGKALVVFGPLGLNNDGDMITVRSAGGAMLATATYGAEGGDDQSLTRASDGDPRAAFVKHRTVAATPASPGTRASGQPF